LGKLLTKQQEESKLLLQRLQRKKKGHWQYVSLHCDTIHDEDDHRPDKGKALVQAKSKQSKAKQTTSREGRRTRGSGSCSFPRQVGRTVDTGREKGVQGGTENTETRSLELIFGSKTKQKFLAQQQRVSDRNEKQN